MHFLDFLPSTPREVYVRQKVLWFGASLRLREKKHHNSIDGKSEDLLGHWTAQARSVEGLVHMQGRNIIVPAYFNVRTPGETKSSPCEAASLVNFEVFGGVLVALTVT